MKKFFFTLVLALMTFPLWAQSNDATEGISTSKEVDLGLSVHWAGYNVGAESPQETGSYFPWGEVSSLVKKGSGANRNDFFLVGDLQDMPERDAATANWGSKWRMPSLKEVKELIDLCSWEWIEYKGVMGYRITGPNGNAIFLPAAGFDNGDYRGFQGSAGLYWSTTPFGGNTDGIYLLIFNEDRYSTDTRTPNQGCSVRPVCTK